MWPFNFLPCFHTSSTCFLLPSMLPCSYLQPSQTCRKMDFLTYKLLGFGAFPSSLRVRGKASSELPVLQVSKAGSAQGFTARPPIPCQVRRKKNTPWNFLPPSCITPLSARFLPVIIHGLLQFGGRETVCNARLLCELGAAVTLFHLQVTFRADCKLLPFHSL